MDSADFELRRRQLDEAGIDLQLVALPATIDTESLPPEQALALAQAANDALAERVSVDPQRFLGVISVTMKDIPGSVAEVQRMAGRGFRAVMLFPRCDGEMLVDTPEQRHSSPPLRRWTCPCSCTAAAACPTACGWTTWRTTVRA